MASSPHNHQLSRYMHHIHMNQFNRGGRYVNHDQVPMVYQVITKPNHNHAKATNEPKTIPVPTTGYGREETPKPLPRYRSNVSVPDYRGGGASNLLPLARRLTPVPELSLLAEKPFRTPSMPSRPCRSGVVVRNACNRGFPDNRSTDHHVLRRRYRQIG